MDWFGWILVGLVVVWVALKVVLYSANPLGTCEDDDLPFLGR